MPRYECSCGWPVHSEIPITITCPQCKELIVCGDLSEPQPTQPKKDPKWVSLVRLLRIPSDTGIGDTLQRQFAKLGGEQFKEWAAKLGIDCGCTQKQDYYNKKYPY